MGMFRSEQSPSMLITSKLRKLRVCGHNVDAHHTKPADVLESQGIRARRLFYAFLNPDTDDCILLKYAGRFNRC